MQHNESERQRRLIIKQKLEDFEFLKKDLEIFEEENVLLKELLKDENLLLEENLHFKNPSNP